MPTSPSTPEGERGAPLVTVATVVLNAAADLALTLESILAQDLPGVERIVVDGMSWDDTPAVLARYRDALDRIETVEDAGIFHAMNEAARLARGEFILFMNAGDRFHGPQSLRRLVELRPAGADVVFGNHIYRSDGVEEYRAACDFGVQVERLRTGDVDGRWLERFPAHQATLTRTALLRRLGYDTALRVCADHDFLLRAAWDGADIAYVDEIVAEYAGGGYSARNAALLRLEFNAVYRSYSERPEAVDRLLLEDRSPFTGQRSPFAGGVVSGVSPLRSRTAELALAEPHRLVHAGGARLVTPVHCRSTGLRLAGDNPGAEQIVRVFDGEALVASGTIPEGRFTLALAFSGTVAARSIVDLVPSRMSATVDGVPVAFALLSVAFDAPPPATPLPRGEPVRVKAGMDRAVGGLLGDGWWSPEPEHVWSTAEAGLTLSCRDAVTLLRLTVRGNPALDGQRLDVAVNGVSLGAVAVGPAPAVVEFPLDDSWRPDGAPNAVTLVPSAAATVGGDPRALGVALVAVELA